MVDRPRELIGQVPGEMIAIDADVLVREASTPGRFQDLTHGYTQTFFSQAAYSAACNALHQSDQRAARWLLRPTTASRQISSSCVTSSSP
jgi:DNA-binding transcriptional regulator YbjK